MTDIRQLSKTQTLVQAAGGLLMVGGALTYFVAHTVGTVLYIVGSLAFVAMQWLQRYEGRNLTMARLRRIQVMGGLALLAAGLLMVANSYVYTIWATWHVDVYNAWVVALLVGALVQLYTAFRMDAVGKADKG
jgi:drug/metabolite transporter (DMT)-like permease